MLASCVFMVLWKRELRFKPIQGYTVWLRSQQLKKIAKPFCASLMPGRAQYTLSVLLREAAVWSQITCYSSCVQVRACEGIQIHL